MTAPSLLSLAEVARRLGLDGPDAARRLVQKTGSPYRKVGRATKLSDDDYAALLEALKRCSIPEKAGRSRMSAARFEPARLHRGSDRCVVGPPLLARRQGGGL